MTATGKICSISNCITRVWNHGTICAKHRWRKKKYGSYDTPGYTGEPNLPIIPRLPDGIVKICQIHGELKEEQTYPRYYKQKISSYYCKECTLDKNRQNTFGGMSKEDFDRLENKQNNLCAICHKPEFTRLNGKTKRLSIDHCHQKQKEGIMKIRGLLCQGCNSMLGYAKDSPSLLQSAIDYLNRS